jgi:hypothetical protein
MARQKMLKKFAKSIKFFILNIQHNHLSCLANRQLLVLTCILRPAKSERR